MGMRDDKVNKDINFRDMRLSKRCAFTRCGRFGAKRNTAWHSHAQSCLQASNLNNDGKAHLSDVRFYMETSKETSFQKIYLHNCLSWFGLSPLLFVSVIPISRQNNSLLSHLRHIPIEHQ